ncbi:MAG: hypothetical protein ACYDGR_13190 [Candidatus Dormibacteria bacterium]
MRQRGFDPLRRQRLQHRTGNSTFGVMVLGNHDTAPGRVKGAAEAGDIDGLDRVEVKHAGPDPLPRQGLSCGQALVHRDPGPGKGDLVRVRFPHDPRASHPETLARLVERGVCASGGAHIDDSIRRVHLLHQGRRGNRVARVQDD